MRRTTPLAAALAGLLIVSLAACGDDDADTTAAPPVTEAPAADTPDEPAADHGDDHDEEPAEEPAQEPAEGGTTLEVVATDFAFEGLPTELAAGTYTIELVNEGAEEHEIALFKNPSGLSLEELFALPQEEAMAMVEIAGVVYAQPGQAAPEAIVAELTPGQYIATCFIPTPTDGRPHFLHGMQQEITVS